MSDPKASNEPSMEEILASIRQIINQSDQPAEELESDAAPAPAIAAPEADEIELLADTAPEDEDVLELTAILDEVAPEPEPMPEPETVMMRDPEPVPAPPPPPIAPSIPNEIITGTTAAVAAATLSSFANTLHQDRMEHSLPIGNNARTLESMVVEAIKPLLKEWLDENLPSIVERVVQQEVEKLTRRIGG